MNGGGFGNCEGQDGKNTVIDVNPDPGKQKAIHREGNHVRNSQMNMKNTKTLKTIENMKTIIKKINMKEDVTTFSATSTSISHWV